jgi:light-regulated signal transduction histidine kinase (bacteriophytochrome)
MTPLGFFEARIAVLFGAQTMISPANLLIIDDSEDDRDLYERFLKGDTEIKRIDLAEDGEEGLALYRERPADCVLLDFNMPGDDGLAVLERLQAIDPHVAVVMMTGAGSQDIAVAVMKAGALDYVVKDTISAAVLRRAIANATEKASLVRELAAQREEQINFIRVLVHDIRAPLRGLTSFTEILEEDLSAGVYEDITDHLEMIKTSAMRMNALVDTLAHYALLDRDIAFEMVSMDEVMNEVLDHLHMVIEEKGAHLNIGSLPSVTGHKPQLVQLFQNLIGNGIKYNQSPEPAINVACDRKGGQWLFLVEDNGIGIPREKLNTVFEPFQRLWSQDVYEGTGLGLAICKKIVERHGGQIWCESEERRGSRFYLTLPSSD